jgi:hypothetical protein
LNLFGQFGKLLFGFGFLARALPQMRFSVFYRERRVPESQFSAFAE